VRASRTELIAALLDAEERELLIRACVLLERLDKALRYATNDYQEPSCARERRAKRLITSDDIVPRCRRS